MEHEAKAQHLLISSQRQRDKLVRLPKFQVCSCNAMRCVSEDTKMCGGWCDTVTVTKDMGADLQEWADRAHGPCVRSNNCCYS